MSTPPQYPQYPQQPPQYPQQPPQYPQQPQYPVYPPPRPRNKALPWLIGGAVVVVAAIAVTLVLVLGGDDDDPGTAGGDGTSYDLSSPEKAAESLVAAAKRGDANAFLKLTCVGTPECVAKFGEDADSADVASMRDKIMSGLSEFSSQMAGAEFGAATEASEPGVMEVPYETPGMVEGEQRGLMFIELNGQWLWYGSSGGGSAEGGGAGSEGGGGHPGDASVEPEEPPTDMTTTVSCPPPDTDDNPFPNQPPVEGCS